MELALGSIMLNNYHVLLPTKSISSREKVKLTLMNWSFVSPVFLAFLARSRASVVLLSDNRACICKAEIITGS